MHITGSSIDEAYSSLVLELVNNPEFISNPRGMQINESLGMRIDILDPTLNVLMNPTRAISKKYMAGETAFYFSGSDKLGFISHYAKFWKDISDDNRTVGSCYGKRIFKQGIVDKVTHSCYCNFDYARLSLEKDPDARKAIVTVYKDYMDNQLNTKDNACTMFLQFFIRNGRLYLHTHMRSNDVWLGFPYDVFFFTLLQQKMAFLLGCELGTYSHIVGSMHLYNRNMPKAKALTERPIAESLRLPPWTQNTECQMDSFLKMETRLRLGMPPKETVDDPLLMQLFSYIEGGQDDSTAR